MDSCVDDDWGRSCGDIHCEAGRDFRRRKPRVTQCDSDRGRKEGATTTPAGDVFSEPLPDPLTLHGERNPFAALQGGQFVGPAAVRLDPSLASSTSVSPLIDDHGRLALASINKDGVLSITSAPAAGTFKGTLSKPGTDGKPVKLTTVSLTARDFLLWPLAVLVIGLALALGIDNWFTKAAPRRAVEARLIELEEQSAQRAIDSARELKEVPEWVGADRNPIRLFEPDPPRGVLAQAKVDALKDYDETPTPTKRDERWGAQGTEFSKIQGYLDSQDELGYLSVATNQSYIDARTAIGKHARAFGNSPIANEARESLSGGRIDDVTALQKKIDSRRDISARVAKASELAKILVRLEDKLPANSPERSKVDALRIQLADMPRGSIEEITAIGTATNQLWNDVITSPKNRSTLQAELDPDDYDTLAAALRSFFSVDTGGGSKDAQAIQPTARELREALARSNQIFLVATGAIVVAAPFGTQYLANPAFGSAADYVALFVWSFTAAALVQLLKYGASAIQLTRAPSAG